MRLGLGKLWCRWRRRERGDPRGYLRLGRFHGKAGTVAKAKISQKIPKRKGSSTAQNPAQACLLQRL